MLCVLAVKLYPGICNFSLLTGLCVRIHMRVADDCSILNDPAVENEQR